MSALSVQLYSVRDALAADRDGTLAALAGIGLTKAEPFGFAAADTALVAAAQRAGLATPSAHGSVVDVEDREALFAAAAAAGVATVVEPFLPPERWTGIDDVEAIAAALNHAAEQAAAHGVTVGYHNHAWELSTVIDGVTALEALAARLDDRVALEVDTYWAEVGGRSAVELLTALGDRVTHIHVKDGDRSGDTARQQPAGSGELPIRAIVAAAPQAVPVVEFDAYGGDVLDGIAASVAFLTGGER
ncbi:sugar phosphate isomerase/epimerase [Mycetocola reblochoni]|uniref:Sugar phosphate isomerase/epimerase n=1 Tax=Mycetocola reblochoni TaxID=331618 RepID=A0A3L6ZS59_9MICO|nr:sugar phosphate isomerase/epimerase [Mycetocola reblochoni]